MKISHSTGQVIMKLSDSFDYAAKILLALERDAILIPPISKTNEDKFASAIYEYIRPFDPHTDHGRLHFEDKWSQIHDLERRYVEEEVKIDANDLKLFQKAKEQHDEDPSSLKSPPSFRRRRTPSGDNHRISRMSVGYHYAAVLFSAISKIPSGQKMPPETEALYALAVFENFNSMKHLVDRKYTRSPIDWANILDTRIEYGYHAASSLHARPVAVCKQCNGLKNKGGGVMRPRERENGTVEWFCLECGGTETIKRKMDVTNMKRREGRVAADIIRFLTYRPVYKDLAAKFSLVMKNDTHFKENLKSEFTRLEKESHKLSFHTPYGYYIQHYDSSKEGKRRRCYISKGNIVKIGITDIAYMEDIRLLVGMRKSSKRKLQVYRRCLKRLMKLKFPTEYDYEKVIHDVLACYH